jgi:hypothetical protein
MPLNPDAKDLIRRNLESIHAGQRVPRVAIGRLTRVQIEAINAQQMSEDLPLSIDEVVFVGRHIYKRRIVEDGYGIEDTVDQIESALAEESQVLTNKYMTAIRNPNPRKDRFGNLVNDEAILECTRYRPYPDLFSVMPKGDKIRPEKQKGR